MKPTFVLFLLVLLTGPGCTESSAPAGPALPENTVTLTFTDVTGEQANLLLTNTTETPVYYLGFGKEHPLKKVEVLTDTGWCAVLWDWCGTGAELQEVPSHSSAVIIAPAQRHNIKTRVAFSITHAPDGAYEVLTSDEFIVP
jgi:hypothetical protein